VFEQASGVIAVAKVAFSGVCIWVASIVEKKVWVVLPDKETGRQRQPYVSREPRGEKK
jgi:hypothetical protein